MNKFNEIIELLNKLNNEISEQWEIANTKQQSDSDKEYYDEIKDKADDIQNWIAEQIGEMK